MLDAVVAATVAAGPPALREAARSRHAAGTGEDALAGWLAGAELDPVDRYLARASLGPVLEALGERAGRACAGRTDDGDGAVCPCCQGDGSVERRRLQRIIRLGLARDVSATPEKARMSARAERGEVGGWKM